MTDVFVQFLTAPPINVEVPPNPQIDVVIGGGGGGRGGTVTSVGLELPDIFDVTGSPVTSAGTLAGALVAQAQKTFFAGPASGANAVPTFRTLTGSDIPDVSSTYLTVATAAATYQPKAAILTTLSALADAVGWLHNDGTGVLSWSTPSSGGGGSVTSVGLSMPGIFTVSGSPVTTAGILAAALVTQVQKTFFAGPTSGANAVPTFRTLVATDVPDLSGTYQVSATILTTLSALANAVGWLHNDGTGVLAWTTPSGGGTGASPTASVGLTVVNGVATTFMRSDAAPPLSQSITPTMTGNWIFSASIVVGSPTGGSKGAGTINATGLYVNGVAIGTGGGTIGGSTGATDTALIRANGTGGSTIQGSTATLDNGGTLNVTKLGVGGPPSGTHVLQVQFLKGAGGVTGMALGDDTGSGPDLYFQSTTTPVDSCVILSRNGHPIRFQYFSSGGLDALVIGTTGGLTFSTYTTNGFLKTSGANGTVTVDTTTYLSGTVGPGSGGTGLTSYAVGDMLFASAAATLSKLAAVAVGQVLVSKGVTTAPAWSPSLTLSDTTDATSITTGSFVTAGGLAVAKKSFHGDVITFLANATNPATVAGTCIHLVQADGISDFILADASAVTGFTVTGRSCEGTLAAPTATIPNRILAQFTGRGYANGAYTADRATVELRALNAWSATDSSTYFQIQLTPSGSNTLTTVFQLNSARLAITGFFNTLDTTDATSATTGSIVAAGGLAVAKKTFHGDDVIISDQPWAGTQPAGRGIYLQRFGVPAAINSLSVINGASTGIPIDAGVCRGTSLTAISATQANDGVIYLSRFYDGTAWSQGVRINLNAADNWTATSHGTYFTVQTIISGTTILTDRFTITPAGSIVAGTQAALATSATDGFLYIPSCAGTPSGAASPVNGMVPIVINTTANKLMFYSTGAWRDAGP